MAIMLVLLAVAMSSLRLMLPYAENYRLNLQHYVNDNYQLNLVIGNLDAGWLKLGPSLVAKNVSLLQTEQASIFIDKIDISVDFWASIKARQIITNDFTLTGAKIFVDKNAIETQLDIKTPKQRSSLDKKQPSKIATFERITKLFLTQIDHFSMRKSQIMVQTSPVKRRSITINQLTWKNNAGKHNAQGDVVFGNLSAKNLKLQLSLVGDSPQTLAGMVYLEGNNLDITPWLGKVLKIANEDINSSINFKSWLSLKQGSAEKLQVELGENFINWNYQGNKHQLSLLKGQFTNKFFGNLEHFQLSSSPLTFTLDQESWQPLVVQASNNYNTFTSYFSGIALQHLTPLIPLMFDDISSLNHLQQLSPKGEIKNVFLQKQAEHINVSAEFDDISLAYSQGIPGIEHLSGDFLMTDQRFRLAIKAKQGKLDFDEHFIRALPYRYISAVLNGKVDKNGWRIASDDLIFHSSELELSGAIAVKTEQGMPIELSLLADVKDIDAHNAQYYFPHLLMGHNLVTYLNKGIVSGTISKAKILFNGPIDKFPFTDHSGIFTVDAELSNSTFAFDPQWPAIEHFNANLKFINNSMLITGHSGDLLGVNVAGVTAQIDDLTGEQILKINAPIVNADLQAVQKIMAQGPLKDTVGKTLEHLTLKNNVNGKLSLRIPLNKPEQTVASGIIKFKNNQLTLKAPAMNFEQVNGQLSFKNDQLDAKNLSLTWLGMPLTLDVASHNSKDFYQTNININADWSQHQWQAQVPELLRPYANGALAWQGKLNLFMPHNGEFSYKFTLNSDLETIQLKLPLPYEKALTKKLPLVVKISGQQNQSTIEATLGNELSFYGDLIHQPNHFSRAHLILGDEQMLLPMDGFHITTNISQADFGQWQPFIANIISSVGQYADSSTANEVPLLSVPQRVRGSIDQLALFGQTLSDVSFNLVDQKSWWLLQLNSKEARSQIKFYPDWKKQGIDVDADFLHLQPQKTADINADEPVKQIAEKMIGTVNNKTKIKQVNDALFAAIPPMRVHCESCSYGKLDFGTVDFSLKRTSNNLISLNNFTAKRGENKLLFDASWQHNAQKSITTITGQAHTSDIAREFEQLGYASVVKESGGTIGFNINWQGGPQEFDFSNLNGDLRAKIDDGYLSEVKDKARVFSILSLGSLVRKLTLDFRDIFSDGMFYTHIKGDFHLNNGIVYTNNTKMKGAAGDLVMKGNTDLSSGKLDYRVSYKPNLTSSLPVLAWISTLNPVTLLAGVAIDQVISSSVVSEFKFELTGTALEPNWREVTRKTRDVTVGRSTPPEFADNKVTPKNNSKPVIEPPVNKQLIKPNQPKNNMVEVDPIDG